MLGSSFELREDSSILRSVVIVLLSIPQLTFAQVTFGMMLIGAVGWIRGPIVITAQLAGAMASAAVVLVLFPGALNVRTQLSPATSITRGLFIEMFLTAELVFTIFMLAAEKHKATFIAPIGIGLALFIAELAGKKYFPFHPPITR